MAGKITDLGSQTGAGLATGDLLETVDISDTSLAGTGTNKKITVQELALGHGLGMARPTVSGSRDLMWPGAYISGLADAIALTAGTYFYFPAVVTQQLTLASIKTEVFNASAASNIRMGIYTADSNWQPQTLLFDSGSISSATTGVKSFTTSQVLAPGLYLGCIQSSDSAVQVRDAASSFVMGVYSINGPNFGGGANLIRGSWSVTGSYGALPGSGTAWTTSSDVSSATLHLPLFLDVATIG